MITSRENAVQDYSHSPYIRSVGIVLLLFDDLRGQVFQGTTLRRKLTLKDLRTVLEEYAQPEVYQFDIIVGIY